MKRLFERMKYRFDQFLSKGTISLVFSLFFLMLLIVVLIGVVLFFVEPETGIGHLIWVSFMQTLDPGNLNGEVGSAVYMIMMTVATIVGIFITSLFISFILNGFQKRLEKLSKGRSHVFEKNHTLILGWNDNVFVILEELIEANRSVKAPVIVILSERNSIKMNQDIRDNILNTFNTKIICRTGSLCRVFDLVMCNIIEAKSVIILENDMNTIKSLVAISNSNFYQNGHGHVSALMYDKENKSVAKNIGKDIVEIIYLKDAITRIITQTCLQPGLSYVYNELLEFKGDEIYFYQNEQVNNLSFQDATLRFDNAVVIGIVRDGVTMVKPQMNTKILPNDQLILIAEDEDTATFSETNGVINENVIRQHKHKSSIRKEYISIIGFNKKTVDVIQEFNNYLQDESKIRILVNSYDYIPQIEQIDLDAINIKIETFVGETFSREVLEDFMDSQSKYVIIFANENVTYEEQDSQTLLTLLHLRDMEEKKRTKYDIITEISDVRNSEIVDMAKVDDFIISELIANKMLAQISENRELIHIFNHLMSSEGSEIYLKPIQDYIDIREKIDFYTITQAANQREEIAIGYKKIEQDLYPIIKLNPDKSEGIQFHEGDMIIVISED